MERTYKRRSRAVGRYRRAGGAQDAAPRTRPRSSWWPLHHRGRFGWIVHPALMGLFIGLAYFAHSLRADTFDITITKRVQEWTSLDGVLRAVSWLGFTPQSVIVPALVVALLFVLRFRHAALWLAVGMIGQAAVGGVLKAVVARPRPTAALVEVLRNNSGYSFPSGHVLSYTVLFGFLIAWAFHELRNPVLRWLVAVPCAAMIVLVGPSRIYLGAHWALDVAGAYLLGALLLSIVLQLYTGKRAGIVQAPEIRPGS